MAAGTIVFEGIPGGIFRLERVRIDNASGAELSREMELYTELAPTNKRVAG